MNLAMNLDEAGLAVDFDTLAASDGQGVFRVIATDGVNSGKAPARRLRSARSFPTPRSSARPTRRSTPGSWSALPPALVSAGCSQVIPGGDPRCLLSVDIHDYTQPDDPREIFGWTLIDPSQLTIDQSLGSASVTLTIDGTISDLKSPQTRIPITMGVDVHWTATSRPITRPLGITRIEECGPHAKGIGWEMTREAVATGTITINSVPYTSTGSIYALLTRDSSPHTEGPTCY